MIEIWNRLSLSLTIIIRHKTNHINLNLIIGLTRASTDMETGSRRISLQIFEFHEKNIIHRKFLKTARHSDQFVGHDTDRFLENSSRIEHLVQK